MKTSLIIALLLTLGGVAGADDTWKPFTSKDGRFSVEFPGAPNVAAPQQVPTAVGPLETHLFTLEVPNVAFYAIAYVDYPKDKVNANVDSMLASARDGAVAKVQGTLVDEQKKDFGNGAKGLELKIEAKDLMLFGRIMFVQNRLYQILVVVPKPKTTDVPTDVAHFENSFTLLNG